MNLLHTPLAKATLGQFVLGWMLVVGAYGFIDGIVRPPFAILFDRRQDMAEQFAHLGVTRQDIGGVVTFVLVIVVAMVVSPLVRPRPGG